MKVLTYLVGNGKVYRLKKVHAGSANANIFETLLKSVTSPCGDKRKQTIATLMFYPTISNRFLSNCVNVNGSHFYETSKYLIRAMMNNFTQFIQATVVVCFLNIGRQDFHIFPNITSFGNEL